MFTGFVAGTISAVGSPEVLGSDAAGDSDGVSTAGAGVDSFPQPAPTSTSASAKGRSARKGVILIEIERRDKEIND
jgi:hypothetical protein